MSTRTRGILLILLAAVMWSLGGVLIKATRGNPAAVATWRSLFAGAFLVLVMVARRTRPTDRARLVLLGLTYAGTMFGFVIATRLTTAAAAIALQYTAPVWVLIFGMLLLREAPRAAQLPAFALCGVGTALFFLEDVPREGMTGNVLALFSGVCFGLMMIAARSMRRTSSITLACAGNLVAAGVMACGTLFWSGLRFEAAPQLDRLALDGRDLAVTAVMGVAQIGIPYAIFSRGIRYVKAYEASVLGLAEPMLNPVWVLLIHREVPSAWTIGGAVLILSGILFVALPERKKAIPPPPD